MRLTAAEIDQIEPELIRTSYGKWIAVSSSRSDFRFAVFGDTERDARDRFAASRRAWSAATEDLDGDREAATSA